MPISNIELTDNFSVWRDNFNLTVNKVNDFDLKITDYETTGVALMTADTLPTANTLVQRTSAGAIEATSFVEGSSLALKNNIRPLEEGLALINQFNPIMFDWKDKFLSKERDVPGLIAEEVKEFLPQITTHGDAESVFGIKYTKIIAILIKAVQELSSELNTLKSTTQTINETSTTTSKTKDVDNDLLFTKLF